MKSATKLAKAFATDRMMKFHNANWEPANAIECGFKSGFDAGFQRAVDLLWKSGAITINTDILSIQVPKTSVEIIAGWLERKKDE